VCYIRIFIYHGIYVFLYMHAVLHQTDARRPGSVRLT